MWGNCPDFSIEKNSIENLLKTYWEKINIDIINWEKLFDISPDQE